MEALKKANEISGRLSYCCHPAVNPDAVRKAVHDWSRNEEEFSAALTPEVLAIAARVREEGKAEV